MKVLVVKNYNCNLNKLTQEPSLSEASNNLSVVFFSFPIEVCFCFSVSKFSISLLKFLMMIY